MKKEPCIIGQKSPQIIGLFSSKSRIVEAIEQQDALLCRSFLEKETCILGLVCGKRPEKIRHPMGVIDM